MKRRRRERDGEREEGERESTWQPVTMQIHFKALLQKVGSDSERCGETGFWEVTRKLNLRPQNTCKCAFVHLNKQRAQGK